jgi:hypothetical protein
MNTQHRQAIRTLAAQHPSIHEGRIIRAAREAYGSRFPSWMIDVACTARGNNGRTPALEELARSLRTANAVCICGPAHAGKTFAALRWATKHGARWLPASELPGRWDETREALTSAAKATALVIDDLFGAGSGGPVAADCVRVIIARRHDARLPTVMTSSLRAHDVEDKLGEQAAARVSVCDVSAPAGEVHVTGSATEGDRVVGLADLLDSCAVYTDDVTRHERLAHALGLDAATIAATAEGISADDSETLQALRSILDGAE